MPAASGLCPPSAGLAAPTSPEEAGSKSVALPLLETNHECLLVLQVLRRLTADIRVVLTGRLPCSSIQDRLELLRYFLGHDVSALQAHLAGAAPDQQVRHCLVLWHRACSVLVMPSSRCALVRYTLACSCPAMTCMGTGRHNAASARALPPPASLPGGGQGPASQA